MLLAVLGSRSVLPVPLSGNFVFFLSRRLRRIAFHLHQASLCARPGCVGEEDALQVHAGQAVALKEESLPCGMVEIWGEMLMSHDAVESAQNHLKESLPPVETAVKRHSS